MFTVTKNINIKSNCNCILIKNKVHFAIDIFFFQSALTFLEFNALRIFFKSALLFPSTLTQRFMTRINQEIKKKSFFTHIYSQFLVQGPNGVLSSVYKTEVISKKIVQKSLLKDAFLEKCHCFINRTSCFFNGIT